MKSNPPKLARRIFEWYCGHAKVEDLLGDMEEWFHKTAEAESPSIARRKYWRHVLSLLFSYAIRKRKQQVNPGVYSHTSFSVSMLKNYFIVSLRSLYRYRYFSVVNIIGLSLGMSLSLLIITMFAFVKTYDNFHENKDRIYRVTTAYEKGVEKYTMASSPALLAEKLKTNLSGIELVTRIATNFRGEAMFQDNTIPLQGYYVDPEFLSMFSFDLAMGNKASALQTPNSILLTETSARKLFGDESALGKTIEFAGKGSFEVTGILKNLPKNTHFDFESLLPYSAREVTHTGDVIQYQQPFAYGLEFVYMLVKDKDQLPTIASYLDKIAGDVSAVSDATVDYELQPLTGINPGPDMIMMTGGFRQWDYTGFYIFGTICLLILLPACFNYTNISLARALKRAKEIGLRKTMGSARSQIFFQFIAETILVTTVSLVGALLLFFLIRGEFKSMIVFGDSLDLSIRGDTLLLLLVFAIVTGCIAGFAPAIFFAKLNPIQALKSQTSRRVFSGMSLRKGLSIFQFMLSFGFIVALIVFTRQYRYTMSYDFGFQKENVLDVELNGVDPNLFLSEYSKLSTVTSISFSDKVLGLYPVGDHSWMQVESKPDSLPVDGMFVDEKYINQFGLEFLAGKNFPGESWTHEQYMIVNETFLKTFGIASPLDAVGQIVRVDKQDLQIIGVVKDFQYATLHWPVKSFAFRMDPSRYNYAYLKVSFSDAYAGITEMETLWKTLGNQKRFHAAFLDTEIEGSFQNYTTLLKVIGYLGMLAISISLLGMLGMVVYTSETRTKEVGIRKVLGASVAGIAFILSKDYLKLMGWAFVLAIPIAFFVINKMLSSMQYYSVHLTVWDFLLGILTLVVLGISTISAQTIKTASANPAETLKTE